VLQHELRCFGAAYSPRGEQPAPDSEDQRHTDVVRPSRDCFKAGGLFQRRGSRPDGDVPDAVEAAKVQTYLAEINYIKTVAAQRQQAAAAAAAAPTQPVVVTAGGSARAVPAPAAGGSDATNTNTPDWACIRQHESGDNYGIGTAARTSSSSVHGPD